MYAGRVNLKGCPPNRVSSTNPCDPSICNPLIRDPLNTNTSAMSILIFEKLFSQIEKVQGNGVNFIL